MKNNYRKTGSKYERMAGEFLKVKGYQILEYNFWCRRGEIDIIAKDGDCLVFCEVKYRSDMGSGLPSEAVNERKQRKLSMCALYYLTGKGMTDVECRFDVVSIMGDQIHLYQNAFDYIGG